MTRELPDPAKDGALAPADAVADRWATLRAATPARIGLGRSGDAMPMGAVLAFQQAHAAARDAVHAALDPAALEAALRPHPVLHVESAAPDRATYLKRPDLGRRLCDGAAALLAAAGHGFDIVFVVADGLSATAVQAHAAAVLRCCLARTTGFSIAPLVIARQARVALGDPVGEALGARLSVVLIGERPGLSVSDSLGLYLTYDPRPGRRDAERNCISNVHRRGGLSYEEAADRLAWLAREALSRKLTGVALKDDGGPAQIAATP